MEKQFIYDSAPFAQCHASTIVELPGGNFLAAWFGGTHEKHQDVDIWLARCSAGTWSELECVVREPTACWNPVLFHDSRNRTFLFYKVGESPRSWSGVYRISEDGGHTWGDVVYLPAGLLGPVKNKPIDASDGRILCPSSVESYRAWTCWIEIIDGDRWSLHGPIEVPGLNYGVIQPTIWEAEPGHLRVLMRATKEIGKICASESADGGLTWSPAAPADLPNNNSGLDAMKLLDGRIALVYNHTTDARTPIHLAFSEDAGTTWGEPIVVEDGPGE